MHVQPLNTQHALCLPLVGPASGEEGRRVSRKVKPSAQFAQFRCLPWGVEQGTSAIRSLHLLLLHLFSSAPGRTSWAPQPGSGLVLQVVPKPEDEEARGGTEGRHRDWPHIGPNYKVKKP